MTIAQVFETGGRRPSGLRVFNRGLREVCSTDADLGLAPRIILGTGGELGD
jgi:hypothetical protein